MYRLFVFRVCVRVGHVEKRATDTTDIERRQGRLVFLPDGHAVRVGRRMRIDVGRPDVGRRRAAVRKSTDRHPAVSGAGLPETVYRDELPGTMATAQRYRRVCGTP